MCDSLSVLARLISQMHSRGDVISSSYLCYLYMRASILKLVRVTIGQRTVLWRSDSLGFSRGVDVTIFTGSGGLRAPGVLTASFPVKRTRSTKTLSVPWCAAMRLTGKWSAWSGPDDLVSLLLESLDRRKAVADFTEVVPGGEGVDRAATLIPSSWATENTGGYHDSSNPGYNPN